MNENRKDKYEEADVMSASAIVRVRATAVAATAVLAATTEKPKVAMIMTFRTETSPR